MAYAMRTPFKSYDRLKNSGMTEAQARGIVEAIEESEEFSFKELATKSDLLLTQSALKSEMSEMKAELRAEMSEMKADLKSEIAEVKIDIVEIKTEIKGIKSSIRSLQNMFMSGFLVIMVGMVLSYFHH